ncbi:MAG: hypothetical protein AAGU32_19190, partial [Bacillota bacterium]
MKKTISVLLVLVMLAAVFCGCTAAQPQESAPQSAAATESSKPEASASQSANEEKDSTISFLTWRSEDAEVYNTIVEKFEEANPHIKVNMEITSSDQDEYYSVLTTKLSGTSNTVDVF